MPQTIMFIGAGHFQEPGIRKALDMGLRVIATDADSGAPGLKLAHAAHVIDVKDGPAQLRIAQQEKINAVLCVASDVSLRAVAYVAEQMGLPGIGSAVAARSTDKSLMRRAFYEHGVPSPKSAVVLDVETLYRETEAIGFPVVVKPADSAGSRGVRLVTRPEELAEAFAGAVRFSAQKKVVVEAFMEGVEVSCEAFMTGGRMHLIGISDKVRTPPPHLLDIDVIFPSACPPQTQERVVQVAERAIAAVGIQDGPVHMELMMTRQGPVPVELAARGPGFKVFTDILPEITGIDILRALIDSSLGRLPDLNPTRKMACALRFFSSPGGIVASIAGVDKIRTMEGIYDMEIYVKPGDPTRPLQSGSDRIGHVISFAATREQAVALVEQASGLFELRVQQG